jgi:hypothetical protein
VELPAAVGTGGHALYFLKGNCYSDAHIFPKNVPFLRTPDKPTEFIMSHTLSIL